MKLSPEDWIRGAGYSYRSHGNDLYFDCPACGEGSKTGSCSMAAEDPGKWVCSRGTCPGVGPHSIRSGTLWELRVALGEIEPYAKDNRSNKHGVQGGPKKNYEQPKALEKDTSASSVVADYLIGRGISQEVWQKFGLLPVKREGNIGVAFPYRRSGKHVSTKYRWEKGKKERFKNFDQDPGCRQVLYGADLIPPTATSLIIVEGELDALASWTYGTPAVSLPGGIGSIDSWLPDEYEWLERFKVIFLAVDMDVQEKDLKALSSRLGMHRCKRVEMPLKDINACLMSGWSKEDYDAAISRAVQITPKDLKSSADLAESYFEWRFGDKAKYRNGTPWNLPGVSRYIPGKRPGALTFLQGYNFAGKTTAMEQEMGDDCKNGVKCLFCSLEMSANECLDFILPQQLGHTDFTMDECFKSFGGFLDNLWWIERRGRVSVEDLKESITCAVRSFGIEQVYIDNLTCIGMRKDDYNAQAEFASLAKFELAAELNCHVTVATHSRKAQNMRGVSGDRNDMAGAKELSDLADEVIIIRRNEEKNEEKRYGQPTTWVDIDKNRFGKKQGIIALQYREKDNRFYEFENNKQAPPDDDIGL